ncbi:hypothetical protein [Streptomyces sp. NPDC020917]|uniref:hypothetical protein n=1 Tax=Streptomyces sp. NPDC020917 TaxID=3365102 RepID=UPI00378F97D4
MTETFTPTRDEMAAERYGLLLCGLGEDDDEGMIAVGSLDTRRALAAFHWYTRTYLHDPVCDPLFGDALTDLRNDLRTGRWTLTAHPTVFTRDGHGWIADPVPAGTPGAVPAVWLGPPLTLPVAPRCPAAHPDDPTPCIGPAVVTVLDATNAGVSGCEHHAARLLASLDGGRVYALPDAPDGAALRVFAGAADIRPFAWTTEYPCPGVGEYGHGLTGRVVHWGCCPASR